MLKPFPKTNTGLEVQAILTLRFQTMNFDATFGIVPSCFSQAFAVSIYLTIKCMLGIHKVE